MNSIITLLEKIISKIRIKFKILYWKLKYGKRIKIGKNLSFRKRFNILIEKEGYLEIGDNNFFNNDCSINCLNNIKIGNDNLFGENVKIYDHNHVFNSTVDDLKKKFTKGEICIGNANWVGSNCVLLKKTNLKDRNVIGAGIVFNEKLDSLNIVKSNYQYDIKEIKLK